MLRVLGPLVVEGPDGPVSVGGPIPRRVLCALLVRPGAVVSVDALIDAAWGDNSPASAERTLISHLTRLREALVAADAAGPARLERQDGGYRVVVAPEAVDAVRLENVVGAVKDVRGVDAVAVLRDALGLWRPPGPFADLQETAYPAAEAARLVELRGAAVEALVEAHLDAGDAVSAAAEAEARLREDPFRERLWELLVLALYRQGRQGDALQAYRRAAAELRDGLGVDPGPRLRDLEGRVLAQDPGLLAVAVQSRRPCPYKGLARYDAADAELFVGRERLVEELIARLVDQRYLLVVGPSGTGKSSLVRAGLVPALAAGALPGSQAWALSVVVPGTRPVQVLEAALVDRPDVLVVDQAEEALLAEDGACLTEFGDELLAAAEKGTRVVLVLRADFFGLLAAHPGLARRAGPATVLVGPPQERELRRIVTEPAARVGLRVEPALADLVAAEVRDRPGVLPVLSTALVRTWEHRDGDTLTVASYRAGGGVAGALQRVGEEAWATLTDDEQRAACRRILLRLAVNEDGTWVRRWARRADIVTPDDPATAAALAVLTDQRLLVVRADDVSIAHEALLTGWPRLHGWLEDGRSRAAVRERLAVATTAWEESGHDPAEVYRGTRLQAALDVEAAAPEELIAAEHAFLAASTAESDRQLTEQKARADREARGRRRARLAAAGLAVALVFAASAGGYAVTQQRQAQQAALAADASRLGAEARSGGAFDRSLLLAAQAVTLDPSPGSQSDLFATLLRGDAVLKALRAGDRVPSIAFADGGREVLAITYDGLVHGWRTDDAGTRPASASTLNLEGGADGVQQTNDGSLVVSRTGSNTTPDRLEVVDPVSGQVRQRGPDVGGLFQTRWSLSQDGRVAVLAGPFVNGNLSHEVLIWRLGTPATALRRVRIGAFAVRIVPCGPTTMCVLTDDQRLLRINLAGAVESDVKLPGNTLDTLAADAAGRTAAVAGDDGLLRLIDTRSGRVLRTFGGPSRDPRVLAMSPDGSRLVGGDVGTVYFWRTDRDWLPERYDVHGGRVTSAAWSSDGAAVATGAEDGTVVLWDVDGRRRVGAVLNDALDADTSTLWATPDAIVVGQMDYARGIFRLIFVDPHDGSIHPAVGSVPGLGDEVIQTARSGDRSALVVTADSAGLTAVWDSRTHRLLGTVPLPAPDGSHATDTWVSPDGTTAATIRTGAGPILFDVASRRVLRTVPLQGSPDPDQFTKVQGWTADGSALLVSRNLSPGDDLLVVDARTGSVSFRVATGSVAVGEVAADPAGRFLALSMNDGSVRVVDARDGHPLVSPLNASSGSAINVSVSPDGRYFAVSGFPPQVTVWDTRTFTRVGVPLPVDANATDARARFTLDGRLVVTSGDVMRVFTIDPRAWLTRACAVAGRTLSRAEFEAAVPRLPYRPACAGT